MLTSTAIRRSRPAVVVFAIAAGLLSAWMSPRAEAAAGIDSSEPARLVRQSLLLDVASLGDRMVIVGERGHVLLSADRGETWTQADVPTRSFLTAVTAVGEGTFWAVGHDAVIIRSGDGGETWERLHWAPDWETPLFDVWFENANHGVAIGAYGLFLETTDGGQTWVRKTVDEDEPHFYMLSQSPGGRLYAAGEFGALFASDDKGATWVKLSSPYEGSFFGILALDDDSVLAFGLRGNLFRSDDGGASWAPIDSGTETGLFAGLQLDDGTIAIVGQSGNIALSVDGGRTFELHNIGNRKGLSSAAELGGHRILLVGEGGIQLIEDVRDPAVRSTTEPGDAS